VGDAIDISEGVASAILKDELESTDSTDTCDGRRLGGEGDTARDTEKLRRGR
jgi:hypothetical protein